jgi:hypothetical protein
MHSQRPFFRTTTGLIPPAVWRTSFGADRAKLIGHALDAEKLGAKIPQNLSNLDLHLSLLEPMMRSGQWVMPTKEPSLADISLYYQLRWGLDISVGKGIYNLTGGGTRDTDVDVDVVSGVFNRERFPGVWRWFHELEGYLKGLPDLETVVDGAKDAGWKDAIKATGLVEGERLLVSTPVDQHPVLDAQRGLVPGVSVSVAPDDTGRDDPTVGKLVRIGVEEVVIKPSEKGELDVNIHFPRLGFVVKVVEGSRL